MTVGPNEKCAGLWGNSEYTEVKKQNQGDGGLLFPDKKARLSRFTVPLRNDRILRTMPGKKLLVADDSLTIQKVIRLALSSAPGDGYEIQTVSDGNDAIQQISLFRPDVVLIDVSLPTKNAFEVKRAINEHADLAEVRFVLMSSAFEKYDESQAEEVGFHGKLSKPFDPAHLRQVLSDSLAQVAAKRLEKTEMLTRPSKTEPEFGFTSTGETRGGETGPRISLSPPEDSDHLPISLGDDGEPDASLDLGAEYDPPAAEPQFTSQQTVQQSSYMPEEDEDEAFAPIRPVESTPPASSGFGPGDPAAGWSLGRAAIPPSPQKPPARPPQQQANSPESDIRHLTESTIRLSGLDDFQWGREESTKRSAGSTQAPAAPAAPPQERQLPPSRPPQMDSYSGLSGSGFRLDPPSEDPLSGMIAFHPENAEEAASGFIPAPPAMQQQRPPYQQQQPYQQQHNESEFETTEQETAAPQPEIQVMPFSNEQIEELLRKQIQETFQKMAEKILPEIAERVIKQEISRLLRDGV